MKIKNSFYLGMEDFHGLYIDVFSGLENAHNIILHICFKVGIAFGISLVTVYRTIRLDKNKNSIYLTGYPCLFS